MPRQNPVIEIARYRPRHLRRVLQIERACFPQDPYTRAMFRVLYRDCGELFLIGKIRRRIAGYIATCLVEGNAEIISIAVDPAYRRAGLGTALLEHTLERLEKAGVRSAELMVRVDNQAAIRFYRRCGFRRAGLVAGYYEDGHTGLRMRRRLNAARPA